jgi:hypothetical protein
MTSINPKEKYSISHNLSEGGWMASRKKDCDTQLMGTTQKTDETTIYTLWGKSLIDFFIYPYNIQQAELTREANDTAQLDDWDTETHNLENFIAHRMFKVPSVEYVIISKKEDSREIWTIINKLNRKVRRDIYDIEYTILELFKQLYFNFHVMCRENRDISEFFTSKDKLIFKRP